MIVLVKYIQDLITKNPVTINTLPTSFASFLVSVLSEYPKKILVFNNRDDSSQFFRNNKNCLYFNDFDQVFSNYPSKNILVDNLKVLNATFQDNYTILTTFFGFHTILPPISYFKDCLQIKLGDIYPPLQLLAKLVNYGYRSTDRVVDFGDFCKKGNICDLYLVDGPIRVVYRDDEIVGIYYFDIDSGISDKKYALTSFDIHYGPYILMNNPYKKNLHTKLKSMSRPNKRSEIISELNEGKLFNEYPYLWNFAFDSTSSWNDYLGDDVLVVFFGYSEGINNFKLAMNGFEKEYQNNLLPYYLYNQDQEITKTSKKLYFSRVCDDAINIKNEELRPLLKQVNIDSIIASGSKNIAIVCPDNSLVSSILEKGIKRENIFLGTLERGLYFSDFDLIVAGYFDLNIHFREALPVRKKVDLFAEQFADLKLGDYVSHEQFGIGIYQGLATLTQENETTDYMLIEYAGNDKIYLPIYRLSQVAKHADSSNEIPISSLGSGRFSKLKQLARESAKKLAIDLVRLNATRMTTPAFSFSPPDDGYRDFVNAFPYPETADQKSAMLDILEDMLASRPMDRLICGDVGFGKTELAMRAAYIATASGKQVIVLVPTTILALQHYHSFCERFASTGVIIDHISRIRKSTDRLKIREKIIDGKIDILIGTHAILSDRMVFKNLGLIIVDEEHRFGVLHKEKLKVLKASIDCLTLTATPIPRTLQLAFLGLKGLSLIQVPPVGRLSVTNYFIKKDSSMIKKAILNELSRNGQVFYVYNRIEGLEKIAQDLKQILPDLKMVITHGKLKSNELEKRITDFYQHKYDLILTTSIIESGLDIQNANTMIIDGIEKMGLAQLHQLRGRIGRSTTKAYCYFILPDVAGANTLERILILQRFADLGHGLNLASSDLEVRGAGDILGKEQSGHINSIGLENYLHLLKEEIAKIKGEVVFNISEVEIKSPFPAYIPDDFIVNGRDRLKYYKLIANIDKLEDITSLKTEISDIFGELPVEVNNLFNIIEVRLILIRSYIMAIQITAYQIVITINPDNLPSDTRDRLINIIKTQTKTYRMNQQSSQLIYTSKDLITPQNIILIVKTISMQLD